MLPRIKFFCVALKFMALYSFWLDSCFWDGNITWMVVLSQRADILLQNWWDGDINRTFSQLQILRRTPKLKIMLFSKICFKIKFEFILFILFWNLKSFWFLFLPKHRDGRWILVPNYIFWVTPDKWKKQNKTLTHLLNSIFSAFQENYLHL